ncbi:hypothetical protein ACO0LD_27025 [Undibacterium sp. Ji83W]|uniref:hypothetical protein n=1 Tax=Undibacterium sp. Ji83W TaxID=3413043 RepID=UPI003BF1376B
MIELNVVTAVPIGSFAAAIWAVVLIRRFLRSSKFDCLSSKQRLMVWGVALFVFLPALFVSFMCAVALSAITVKPGSNHRALALTVIFSLGIFGSTITWALAKFVAFIITKRRINE